MTQLIPPERAGILWYSLALTTVLSLNVFGCKDDGDGKSQDGSVGDPAGNPSAVSPDVKTHAMCNALEAKLKTCSLLGGGTYGCIEPYSSDGLCVYDCLLIASCEHLGALVCNVFYGSPLEKCIDDCYGITSFICEDGSYSVPEEWVCDGENDCADGSDEIDCPDFICLTTQDTIPETHQCDNYLDCPDGSDEENCPQFTCGDGATIPEAWICDFEADCVDGSDEAQCDGFVCGDGRIISPDWVCDFEADCADGSDETGCAGGLQCSSGERIPEAWICDLYEDCLDGTDEANCSYLECGDGYAIPWEWECDGEPDCLNGSDEHAGCAAYLCAT